MWHLIKNKSKKEIYYITGVFPKLGISVGELISEDSYQYCIRDYTSKCISIINKYESSEDFRKVTILLNRKIQEEINIRLKYIENKIEKKDSSSLTITDDPYISITSNVPTTEEVSKMIEDKLSSKKTRKK